MKRTELIMGMPITVTINSTRDSNIFKDVFDYFRHIDQVFSPYKTDSELSKLNNKEILQDDCSLEMKEILKLCLDTKNMTYNYFDIDKRGVLDPSGLVKGYAVDEAAKKIKKRGLNNFFIEAGGDIEARGFNEDGQPWHIGIRNPFRIDEIVKVVVLSNLGIATSGTYIRGEHIYDPLKNYQAPRGIASLSVIGPNVFEADRFATAAFAMGAEKGISFIEVIPGFEAYMVNDQKIAVTTKGFAQYVVETT